MLLSDRGPRHDSACIAACVTDEFSLRTGRTELIAPAWSGPEDEGVL